MRHLARALVLAAALGGWVAVPAQVGTIVFDFEDGLQGWELNGSVQRVQTQLLGGEWAIFGDGLVEGGASISVEMDLTDIASISVEQFFVEGIDDQARCRDAAWPPRAAARSPTARCVSACALSF